MSVRYHAPVPRDHRPILQLAHSPDPDDAFMWWPLFGIDGGVPALENGRFRCEQVLDDIESLNLRALSGELAITALSCAHYPQVQRLYALTSCGASMGEQYGPKLVSRKPLSLEDLRRSDMTLAVPGVHTTAFAMASMMLGPGRFQYAVVPFDQIMPRVAAGEFQAGLIIHEGQLSFEQAGLHLIEDVGRWWFARHSLPLPLGVNGVRRDLEQRFGPGTLREITTLLRQSIDHALAHRQESVQYALRFARDMTAELADRFISLYVNTWTLDFGPRGREAVRTFLAETHRAGLTPEVGEIDFIEPLTGVAAREK